MTIVTKKDRFGASRGKLALVGVLVVVLVAVIVMQLPSSTNNDNVPTAAVTDLPGWEGDVSADAASGPPAPQTAPVEKPPQKWPELSMEVIVARDPLAAPPWYLSALELDQSKEQSDGNLAPTEESADALVLADLQQAGATIVLIAGGKRIATIGERQLRIGDRIEGYQVSDITDQGVILTKSKPR